MRLQLGGDQLSDLMEKKLVLQTGSNLVVPYHASDRKFFKEPFTTCSSQENLFALNCITPQLLKSGMVANEYRD